MTNNSTTCKCDRCDAVANSIHGTTHRRCSGVAALPIPMPKGKRAAVRGRWESAK
jgi:hypothetical protein